MKYTEHKLTDHMLRRLSQLKNNRLRNFSSHTFEALERRGLVNSPDWEKDEDWEITGKGIIALDQARSEGW